MGTDPAPPTSEADFTRMFDDAMHRSSSNSSSSSNNNAMSRDEQDKFLSAMKDPEFRSLLSDYMAEISDPANRAETEQYLAQLEGEQKVPADKQLVRPTPGFVVKSRWREAASDAHRKLFVNVCSSDKLQPPSSSSVTQPATGKPGTSWHLPYSVGPERLEKDKGGAAAAAFDVCFHPTALAFAKTQRAYRDMVVNTSLDAVESVLRDTRRKSGGDTSVSRDFRVLKGVAYKSGEPVTMCLRKPTADVKGESATAKKAAASVGGSKASVSVGDSKAAVSVGGSKAASAKTSAAPSPSPTATTKEAAGNSTSEKPIDVVPKRTKGERASDPLQLDLAEHGDSGGSSSSEPLLREVSSTKAERVSPADEAPPPRTPLLRKIAFRLVYRGKFELLHHMQAEHANVLPVDRSRPKELVLEMEFPTLASAAGVDLDVSEQALKLSAKGYEPLSIALPFAVVEAKGSAKFDKKARKLVVTLPVQPPPEPTKVAMVIIEEEDDDKEEECEDAGDETADRSAHSVPEAQERSGAAAPVTHEGTSSAKARADDGFAMLRETAIMVQHDPLYLPREKPDAAPQATARADVETYADLPPLESCSEDEGDDDEDADLVLVEAAASAGSEARSAPFATKETATCLSFIVDVAGIDASSVQLAVPTPTSFTLRFAAGQDDGDASTRELYELAVDALAHAVEPTTAEFDVASDNMVVILTKRVAASAADTLAPVMRFQNHLLYELD